MLVEQRGARVGRVQVAARKERGCGGAVEHGAGAVARGGDGDRRQGRVGPPLPLPLPSQCEPRSQARRRHGGMGRTQNEGMSEWWVSLGPFFPSRFCTWSRYRWG